MALTRRDLLRTAALGAGALALPSGVIGARAGTVGAVGTGPSLRPGGPARVGPWRVLAGSLHDHSTDSDGESAAEAVAQFLAAHRDELGIDYATLSDHSDFFPLSGGVFEKPVNDTGIPNGRVPPTVPCDPTSGTCGGYLPDPANPTYAADLWARQGRLMQTYASPEFSFLRGFEWTNDQQNHFNVLLSSNWTSRAVTGDASLSMTPL